MGLSTWKHWNSVRERFSKQTADQNPAGRFRGSRARASQREPATALVWRAAALRSAPACPTVTGGRAGPPVRRGAAGAMCFHRLSEGWQRKE